MIISTLSQLLYRVTNRWSVALATALFCLYVLWILPHSTDVARIVGTGGALVIPVFRFFIYTPADFYGQLDAYGAAGRAAFVDYRLLRDTLWLITLGAFLALVTSAILRASTPPGSRLRLLNAAAPLPSLFDFLENQLQNVLVLLYPDRHDGLVIAAATLTASKWVALTAAFAILLYALLRVATHRLHGNSGPLTDHRGK